MENFKFEKGVTYPFSVISDFHVHIKNDYEMYEYGNNLLGEELIVLKHTHKDITISFVLVSVTSSMYYYDCVYINA